MEKAAKKNVKLHLPVDYVTGDKFPKGDDVKVGAASDTEGIPDELMGLDIGPKSTAEFVAVINRAHTVLWNGPMGVFENQHFAAGTKAVAEALAAATARGTTTVVGGGDTATAAAKFGIEEKVCQHCVAAALRSIVCSSPCENAL